MLKIQRFSYTPILGWSNSRYATFETCKRQYYYTYYGKFDTEHSPDRIRMLKALSSGPIAVGHLTHEAIAAMLRKIAIAPGSFNLRPGKLPEYIDRELQNHLHSAPLREQYYDPDTPIDLRALRDAVVDCILQFTDSPRFQWIWNNALGQRKDWLIEPDGYGETRIDGMKAYCKVDFLFPFDDKLFIMDWKTGKVDDEKYLRQISGYAAWASFHFERDPIDIISIIAYLKPDYRETTADAIGAQDLDAFARTVRAETEEMHGYCLSVEKNIPRPKADFAMTENLRICAHCNFRELCGR